MQENYEVIQVSKNEDLEPLTYHPFDFILLHTTEQADQQVLEKLDHFFHTTPILIIYSLFRFYEEGNILKGRISKFLPINNHLMNFINNYSHCLGKKISLLSHSQDVKKGSPHLFAPLVGCSQAIQKVKNSIQRVSQSDAPVCITGESGTGKQIVSLLIHEYSQRKGQFVELNCASIPDNLMESELFGYHKGAFSGAFNTYQGKLQLADRGTLLLDEIGELKPILQGKLLNILEHRPYYALGSNQPLQFKGRFIVATNVDLFKEVENKRFRQDLFYRLNMLTIHIPSLKERKEDIPLLIDHFLMKYLQKYHKEKIQITKESIDYLMKYLFEGNVRELSNIIEKAILFKNSREYIEIEDLTELLMVKNSCESTNNYFFNEESRNIIPLKKVVQSEEKRYLLEVSKRKKNVSELAHLLNIKRSSLYRKFKQYDIHQH